MKSNEHAQMPIVFMLESPRAVRPESSAGSRHPRPGFGISGTRAGRTDARPGRAADPRPHGPVLVSLRLQPAGAAPNCALFPDDTAQLPRHWRDMVAGRS